MYNTTTLQTNVRVILPSNCCDLTNYPNETSTLIHLERWKFYKYSKEYGEFIVQLAASGCKIGLVSVAIGKTINRLPVDKVDARDQVRVYCMVAEGTHKWKPVFCIPTAGMIYDAHQLSYFRQSCFLSVAPVSFVCVSPFEFVTGPFPKGLPVSQLRDKQIRYDTTKYEDKPRHAFLIQEEVPRRHQTNVDKFPRQVAFRRSALRKQKVGSARSKTINKHQLGWASARVSQLDGKGNDRGLRANGKTAEAAVGKRTRRVNPKGLNVHAMIRWRSKESSTSYRATIVELRDISNVKIPLVTTWERKKEKGKTVSGDETVNRNSWQHNFLDTTINRDLIGTQLVRSTLSTSQRTLRSPSSFEPFPVTSEFQWIELAECDNRLNTARNRMHGHCTRTGYRHPSIVRQFVPFKRGRISASRFSLAFHSPFLFFTFSFYFSYIEHRSIESPVGHHALFLEQSRAWRAATCFIIAVHRDSVM